MITFLVRLSWFWPLVKITRYRPVGVPIDPQPSHTPHRSWVFSNYGLGWIHHHEADGYIIQLVDNRLVKMKPEEFRPATKSELPG